jgi:hypothetical protein
MKAAESESERGVRKRRRLRTRTQMTTDRDHLVDHVDQYPAAVEVHVTL